MPSLSLHFLVDRYYLDALEGGGRGPALYANPEPFACFESPPQLDEYFLDEHAVRRADELAILGIAPPCS